MIKKNELRIGNLIHIRDISNAKRIEKDGMALNVGQEGSVTTDNNLFVVKEILANHVMGLAMNSDRYFGNVFSNSFPIPLTPEILEACKLTKAKGQVTFWYYQIRTTLFSFRLHKDGLLIYKIDSSFNLEINSLHQLQNVIFFLTGEELNVEQLLQKDFHIT